MADAYGASQEAWHHWSITLELAEHLLPVVANPGATISPDSKMQLLGKTPSKYNFRREAAGIPKWTELRTTLREIGKWELEPDYGICIQSREGGVRAIDIDVPNERLSRQIVELIENALPIHNFMFRRTRADTGKLLLPFLYDGELPKHVLQVEKGAVELLGDGQQWIVDSSYLVLDNHNKTNSKQRVNGRYLWPAGFPPTLDALPKLEPEDLASLRDALELLVGTAPWQKARMKRERPKFDGPRPGVEDPVLEHLLEKWDVRDEGREGELFIRCPFDSEHTSDSGPTETVYYPAGTGGYERGHFKCLHSHCLNRADDDYLGAVGFRHDLSDAPELEEPGLPETEGAAGGKGVGPVIQRYMIDKQGRKENRAYNHRLFLDSPECGKRLAWDDFSAQTVWCPAGDKPGEERWALFSDEHYSQLVRQMDRHGFVPQAPSAIRPAVFEAAMSQRVDLAIEWLERLPEWDGIERVETFWIEYAGAADTGYVRAVGRYSWTAQAGRVLDPGCQADMALILVSAQGKRKTSLVAAIAPSWEMFTEINLLDRDDDTSRKMRGKLVVELSELRGLKGRAVEDVKAFISRRVEEWTPKYLEFVKQFKRRFVFYGTTNSSSFLADESGERRYLPFHVSENGSGLKVEQVIADREQLWAEAVWRYRMYGIEWQDAEQLAPDEHDAFKEYDAWVEPIRKWLLEDDPLSEGRPADRELSGDEVLVGALGMRAQIIENKHTMRLGAVMKGLGFRNKFTRRGRRYELVEPLKLGVEKGE